MTWSWIDKESYLYTNIRVNLSDDNKKDSFHMFHMSETVGNLLGIVYINTMSPCLVKDRKKEPKITVVELYTLDKSSSRHISKITVKCHFHKNKLFGSIE